MPSWQQSTPPFPPDPPSGAPPDPPLTPAEAQAALGKVALGLANQVNVLEGIHRALPPPPDLIDRQEHRWPYDVATEILATIECVLADDLRPAVVALQRAATISDAELEREWREWLKARLGV